jgi:hypothetical protein
MPIVSGQLVSPSININQVMPGGGKLVAFQTTLAAGDIVNPANSFNLIIEIAVDISGQPDNVHVWKEISRRPWVGRAGGAAPFLAVYGPDLPGKRLRTTIAVTGIPVDVSGQHLVAAIPVGL